MASKLLLGMLACMAMFWAAGAAAAPYQDKPSLKCSYADKKTNEVNFFDDCTWTDANGRRHMKPQHLSSMAFDQYGLAEVWTTGGHSMESAYWYADRSGLLAPVLMMDNGPDYFSDGLARSPSAKKIGYIDRRFRFVIPAIYDGAHPFDEGRAVVCVGCVERYNPKMEASYYEGGRWGCIDVHGREVIPLKPTKNGDMLFANHCRS
jgi:hypothetical protein